MSKLRIGVFGCGRGRSMVEVMSQHPDADLVAICDKWEKGLGECVEIAEKLGTKVATYKDFDSFLGHGLDAVVLANYATEHAPYAIKCLENNIHVISENVAVNSMDEAFNLLEACKKSKALYSYAENTCFTLAGREMRKLYQEGKIGELLHAEADYIHYMTWDERAAFTENHNPNHWRNNIHSTFYCTHSAGPILRATGLTPKRVMGIEGPKIKDLFPDNDNNGRFGAMIICELSNGAIMKIAPSCHYPRQAINWYVLYGTKGSIESDRFGEGFDKVHTSLNEGQDYSYYSPEFDDMELAKKITTHGGGDFWTMHYFLEGILGNDKNHEMIDIYQALDMTVIGILAQESIKKNGVFVDMPDFRNL